MIRYLFLALVIILGCESSKQNDPYAENIFKYLSQVPNLNLSSESEEQKLIVIPLSGCSPCLEEVLGFLNNSEVKPDIQLLFTGKSIDKKVQSLVQKLKFIYPSYSDEENLLMFYRTNISNPSLLIIDGSKIRKFTLDLNNYSDLLSQQTRLE